MFQSYGVAHARPDEYRSPEAGPSTLVLPLIPYVNQPTSRGITEAGAGADQNNHVTEEDRVTVSNFYCSHIPRVTEWLFGVRSPSRPGSPVAKGNRAQASH